MFPVNYMGNYQQMPYIQQQQVQQNQNSNNSNLIWGSIHMIQNKYLQTRYYLLPKESEGFFQRETRIVT